jgi:erythromycin esterase-like protein
MTHRTQTPIDRWLDAHAVNLDRVTFEPDPGATERLDAIDRMFAGVRCVFLGETNHFVHEKADFRLWWLRRLAARHRLVVGEELGCVDGLRVAGYLDDGDTSRLDGLATFGDERHRRDDRDDRPTGVLRASFDAYPTQLFKAEQIRFYRELRTLRPLRFAGIDIDAPGNGYEELFAARERVDAPDAFWTALACVPGESLAAEADRLEAALAMLTNTAADPAHDAFCEILRSMIENLRYTALAHPAPDYEGLRPAMALRESFLKRRVERLWRSLEDDEVLVLLSHAFHLAKDDRRIGRAGVGPGGDQEPSLGHHLVQRLGIDVRSAWLLYGAGADSQPFPDLPNDVAYPATSINAAFGRRERPFVVAVASAADALGLPVGVGHMYNTVVPVHLPSEADALFFIPRVSPMRG